MEKQTVEIKEFRIEDLPFSCTMLFIGPPGSGKCLAPGTPVQMFNGHVKVVEEINLLDIVMGDDNTPRRVLGTGSGEEDMFEINQDGAMSYTVNASHILTLFDSTNNKIIDINLLDYLKNADARYKGIKVSGNKISYHNISIRPVGKGRYFGFELDGNGRYLLGDGTVTHNTSAMETIAYYLKHRYPVARAFIGTEGAYKRFCDIMHPLYVSNYYNEEEEKSHIKRQRFCELENGKHHPENYAINIIDDPEDPKMFRSKIMGNLFKLGSQHWHQLCMVGSQYAIDLAPGVRKSVSYVCIFREPEEAERKKLYKNFGGIAGSYSNFCDLMDALTGDYTCLVFKKRNQSNRMEDCIFWMKTKKLPMWKFGCKEYREWAKNRYDKNYVEEVIMD